MGLAKLVSLLMVLLLVGSSFLGLFIYFIKWNHILIGNFSSKMKIKFFARIFTKDLNCIAISLNKWWKTRNKEYKMSVVYKKEFEQVKIDY